ncbi:FAD-dependent oxidoreductase [Rudanella paleaurantiibacter]|uniref:Tryptophan 2-monooxygenase n=1 Tax=Rudanella paleaurantiibacter TaxID=2614655 RepID=A0A7J5U2K4_9BACT|nr:FAD-dependent oxidoreductase [Rudanella paleaurantiibacter]KAB7731214.1 FAD-dependent oxidoreductase [Rudanella paleaurantiibacter]
MHRRQFIQNTLTGLPILWTSSLLASSCQQDEAISPNGKTVIVIGAGISGLAAAKKLQEKGFTVIVLEAQEKVGGRLRTNRSTGIAFDEGASWIHGITGNPITALAQQAGMTTFHTRDENRKSYDLGGTSRTTAAYDKAEDAFYEILGSLMKRGNATQGFETVFNRLYPAYANDRLWKFLLSTYLTFDCGDLDTLSSLLYDEGEEFGGVDHIVTNGYDTLATYLAKGLSIQLNQRVTKIDYSAKKVSVTHNSTVTSGDYVLVTVPLGVLKANTIQFTPALPAQKQNAIQNIGMNCVNKFLLTWNTAFWDNVQYLSYTPEIRDKFNYFLNLNTFRPAANSLMTFAYARYARQTESMTDAQVVGEIMAHLRDMYGTGVPNPTQLLRTRWQTNSNSFGSYSYTAVGTEMRHFEDLAEAVNDRLFFAGEHTEVDYFSTVHGAYLSGLREADKIIDLLGS